MIYFIAKYHQAICHFMVAIICIRVFLDCLYLVYDFLIRNLNNSPIFLFNGCICSLSTSFTRLLTIVILMLADFCYRKCGIPLYALENIAVNYFFLFSKAKCFFNNSLLSLPSNSFSAKSCFNKLFSFSNWRIRLKC